jgi:pyridoxamine 5'-phosphate oxidase family protein
MSILTDKERTYLTGAGPRLARLATIGADGMPHLSPVGFTYNDALGTVDIGGYGMEHSKKFRDAKRNPLIAVVIDDVTQRDVPPPGNVRGIEFRGRAEVLDEPRPLIRLHPTRIISWGIERPVVFGEPPHARDVR